jgi:hypothetical protein
MQLKGAREFIEDLVRMVRPPPGCAITLTEAKSAEDVNWITGTGVMPMPALGRYNIAVAEMRKEHPRIDWSGITEYHGERRRISRWLSEVE